MGKDEGSGPDFGMVHIIAKIRGCTYLRVRGWSVEAGGSGGSGKA